MKTKVLTLLLLAGGSLLAGPRVFFGFGFGSGGYGHRYYGPPPVGYYSYAPPPPPLAYAPAPGYAAAGYTWVNGYWDWAGPRTYWRPGYYARPPFAGAYWCGPRYSGGRYYHGYWTHR